MTSDGLPHQVRAVISNAREDSTAVTWYELTRRREQRLAYVRAYGAFWQKGSGGGRAAALEALESKMSLELCMRYRELTRVVGGELAWALVGGAVVGASGRRGGVVVAALAPAAHGGQWRGGGRATTGEEGRL
jgi:hypothetical protein